MKIKKRARIRVAAVAKIIVYGFYKLLILVCENIPSMNPNSANCLCVLLPIASRPKRY